MADASTNQPDSSNGTRDLFLSYNSRDREAVVRVRQLLREKQLSTFLDRDNLNPGQPWFDELQSAIGQVRAVAVFVGETLGPWQKREMTLALDRQAREEKLGRRFPVIPVVLPKADLERAPGFLLLNTFVDLRGRLDDPSALDAIVRAIRGEAVPQPIQPQVELCPYRALRVFREEDAPLFFGREKFAEQLLAKTRQHNLIAVVGPSGSGKSSVVQAGLMPLLRRERPPRPTWDTLVFTPGRSPFHNLAAALVAVWDVEIDLTERLLKAERLGKSLASGEVRLEGAIRLALEASKGTDRLLVVVDQFEELFTQTEEKDRKPFVEALLSASALAPATIALTLRADFYGQAIGLHRELSDCIQQGLVNLGPMTRDELRRAIENPAHSLGLKFESGLVKRILDNIEGQPGNLPLLEFALTELWSERQDHLLTHHQYEEIGEVEGAIGQRAEQLFGSLKPDEQRAALRAFTRLVRVAAANEEGTDTRQRVRLSDLDETARAVAQKFVKARLLVTSRNEVTNEETVEVAHEALIRKWQHLTDVLNKDREFLLWRQRLGFMSREWQRTNKDPGALLGGALLQEAKNWAKERSEELNEQEREFIATSDSASQRPRYRIAAAAALVIVAALAYAGWKYWDNRPESQINKIIRQGPDYVKTVAATKLDVSNGWLQAMVLAGRSNEAFDAARRIEVASYRLPALVIIVEALAKAGKLEEARQAAAEALATAREVEAADSDPKALVRAVEALAKAGKPEEVRQAAAEALAAARKIEGPYSRSPELVRVVEDLVNAGRTEEAIEAINSVNSISAEFTSADFTSLPEPVKVVEDLVKAGKTEKALDAARKIGEANFRSQALLIVGEALAEAGMPEEARQAAVEALDAAREIGEPYSRSQVLVMAVEALTEAGKLEKARQAAAEALAAARKIKNTYFRSQELLSLFEALARGRETADQARTAIEAAQQAAEQITVESVKSEALAKVATGLAKLHLYRQARELVDNNNTSAADKLTAYAAILREYHIEHHPDQAQLFEEEKQKED